MGRPERLHHARKYFVVSTLYSEADLSAVRTSTAAGTSLPSAFNHCCHLPPSFEPTSRCRGSLSLSLADNLHGRKLTSMSTRPKTLTNKQKQTIFSLHQNPKWACATAVPLCSNTLISLEPVVAVSPHLGSWSRCRILEPLSGHRRSR